MEGVEFLRSMEFFWRGELDSEMFRVLQEHGVFKEEAVGRWKVENPPGAWGILGENSWAREGLESSRSMDYFWRGQLDSGMCKILQEHGVFKGEDSWAVEGVEFSRSMEYFWRG